MGNDGVRKPGACVRVKPGVKDPDYNDFSMEGWQGIDDLRRILVKVKRIGDKKTFILPLWDLKTAERKDPNHQMIDDYSYWMSNYR